jgi:NADPH-dependent ferric siderophore reductase
MAQRFETGRVAEAGLVASRFRHVRIAAPSLIGMTFEPGTEVLIRVPNGGSSEERRYSVWKSSAQTGTFEVCVVQHGLGPGSRWAGRCEAGDPVEFSRSAILPIAIDRSAQAHLFLGDETSIASTEAMIGALPTQATLKACFEIGALEHRWPAAGLVRSDAVQWVARTGRSGLALVAWLGAQPLPLADSTTAYVTGEAWLCTLVHAHLVRDRGFRPGSVRAMPYWKERPRLA